MIKLASPMFKHKLSSIMTLSFHPLTHTLNLGINLEHSCCQLCSVDAGAMTRNGPQMPCASARWARHARLWTVLPRPISSANIPLIPWSNRLANQFIPYNSHSHTNIFIRCLQINLTKYKFQLSFFRS